RLQSFGEQLAWALMAQIHSPNQAAAIALTNVYAAPPAAGLYEVSINIEVTTAGTAGTIAPKVASQGDGAAARTQTGAASPAITGLSATSTTFLARCDGSTHLQYGTTFAGVTVGGLQYSLSVSAQRLSD
ncbi:MAG TPA: hypothetical protein VF014_11670, partial [Casimicrobiaceae bacterium]|nr:hypothetical protein [Casimicrobiaceae bacterium]